MNNTQYSLLQEIATVITGVTVSEPDTLGEQGSSFIQLLPSNLTVRTLCGPYTYVSKGPRDQADVLRAGDVVFKRVNPDHVVVFEETDCPVILSPNLFAVRPSEQIDPQYLAAVLDCSKLLHSELHASTSILAAISVKNLRSLSIPMPDIETQRKLGRLWELNRRHAALLNDLKEENDSLTKALIKQFTKE